jgi:hypothetical protein
MIDPIIIMMNHWKPYGKHRRENNLKKSKKEGLISLRFKLALCTRALHSIL